MEERGGGEVQVVVVVVVVRVVLALVQRQKKRSWSASATLLTSVSSTTREPQMGTILRKAGASQSVTCSSEDAHGMGGMRMEEKCRLGFCHERDSKGG